MTSGRVVRIRRVLSLVVCALSLPPFLIAGFWAWGQLFCNADTTGGVNAAGDACRDAGLGSIVLFFVVSILAWAAFAATITGWGFRTRAE